MNKKFLISLPSLSIKHLKRKFGITERECCQVSVQFEVKHSYFDNLHKAVIYTPQTMINKLFPTIEDTSKPLQTAACRVNFKCFLKALSVDEYGQLKALDVIFQSPPNLPIIVSGPFGSGKTRVLAAGRTCRNMPEPETETTPFQSHSNTDNYLVATPVSTDTNPAKYWKENHRSIHSCELRQRSWSTFFILPVDRLFSNTGKIFTPERCRLSDGCVYI